MKCISTLTIFLLTIIGDLTAQVKDINEAKNLLLGGWELQVDNKVTTDREQIYFYMADTSYKRSVQVANYYPNCNQTDTIVLDKNIWKIQKFNKKTQVAKV